MENPKIKKAILVDTLRRDPNRIKRILKLIEEIWLLRTESRFTQLLANLKTINFHDFYLDDQKLEKDLIYALDVIKQIDGDENDKYKLERKKLP